jgi:hypothetical protein
MDPSSTNQSSPPAPALELRPRASRAPLAHAVMCRFSGGSDFVEVTTFNISQSGMLVSGEILPSIGSEMEFKFFLETGFEILSGAGKVMRHAQSPDGKGPAVGIAFAELDPAKQRILARVIELHIEGEGDGD